MKHTKLPDRALDIANKLREIGSASPSELKSKFPDITDKHFSYCIKRLRKVGVVISMASIGDVDMRTVKYRVAYPHELKTRENDLESTLLEQILEVIQNANN